MKGRAVQNALPEGSSGRIAAMVRRHLAPVWVLAIVSSALVLGLRLSGGGPDRMADLLTGATLILVWLAAALQARPLGAGGALSRLDRAAATDPLRARAALADALLAVSTDCILDLDLDGVLRGANPAGLAYLGIGDLEAHAGIRLEALCAEDARTVVCALVERARDGEVGRLVAACPDAGGSARWWDLTVAPVLGATGRPASLVGIGRDVTARWAAEQAREEAIVAARVANRAKSEFLATMSHEIRTPLNGVLGAASFLLATEGLSDEQRRMLRLQQDAGRTLLAVINDILDWTKIEEGRIEFEHVPLSLRDLVDGCMDLVRETAALKPIVLDAEIASDVPDYIGGDPTRLSQVLLNLLGNAVKFTKQGLITVSLTMVDQRLRFAVRDPGIGIPHEKQGRLFQRFSQTDASTTREFGGSGLGLAICKSLIELMGGEIGVISEPGLGSLFWFELSLPAIDPPRTAVDDHAPASTGDVRSLRILVADDVHFNQTIVSALLEAKGHQVVVVDNGADAVEAARRGGFDLILMDVQMPIMDGYAAARAIRALGDGLGGVPILALTAAAYREDEERALSAGMNGHLAKPIDTRTLLAAVRRWTEAGLPDPATDARVMDEDKFADLTRLLGRDRIGALASLLDLQLTRMVAEVVPSGDPTRLVREAHMLVSSAGSFGLVEVTRHAQAILKAGPSIEALAMAADLKHAASDAILALRRHLEGPGPTGGPSGEAGADRQPCVLMAEDETLVMLNVIDFLEEDGFTIKTAATGEEALRLLELGEPVDVLFADVRLPGRMDGLALAKRARVLRPDLPILVTSGHVTSLAGGDLPGARFLPKPYSLAQVSAEIRALAGSALRSPPLPAAASRALPPEP